MGRKKKICGNEPGQQKLGSFFAHPPGPPTGQDDSTSDEGHDISGLPPDSSATAAAATPGFAAPSAVPPSAVPPSAVPPSAVPPSAVPPSAVPPSPLQSQPNPEPDTEPTSPPTPAKKRKIDNFSDLPEKSRSAIGSYCDKYSWLEFVKPGLVRCSSCKASQEYHAPAKPTTWSSGYVMYPPVPEKLNSGNWRANTFRMHEKQTEHKNSLSSKKPPKVQKIDRAVKEMEFQNLGDFAPTKRAIKTVLFTIQEELPIRKAEKIREFMMTVLSESSETAGLMHARHKSNWSTYTFIAAINGDVQTRQLERLKKSVAFTLHADESTDISANSFLLLYVQYTLVDEGGNTEVHPTEFLTVLKVKNGKSVTITNRIIGFFAGHDIDLTKMVMFTSDGANAMLGRKSGVATRLRAVVGDHLIDYHCVSHREALAMKHAYQKFKVWTDLEKDIRSLIKFLAQGKQRTGIEYLTNFLEQDYVEIPKIIDIRWLSRVKSIEALITDYYVLLEFLKAQANGNDMDMGEVDREIAKGFHDNFSKMERLWMIHRLGDLLEPFDVLMKISQKKNMHPYNILQHTETVIKTLQERYHFDGNQPVCWDGDHISQLRISFDESEPEVDRIELTTLLENWPQVQNQVDINVVKLAEELTKQIQSRCGSEKEAGILKETVIFDVGRIRKFNGKLDDYGVESLELYTRYKDFVEINSSQMRKEWRHLLAMYREQIGRAHV